MVGNLEATFGVEPSLRQRFARDHPRKGQLEDKGGRHLRLDNTESPRRGSRQLRLPDQGSCTCPLLAADRCGVLRDGSQFHRHEAQNLGSIHGTTMHILEL